MDQLICLKILRISDSEDAYGRTLAYVYLGTNNGGDYAHLYNENFIRLGLARTTDFSHAYRREFSGCGMRPRLATPAYGAPALTRDQKPSAAQAALPHPAGRRRRQGALRSLRVQLDQLGFAVETTFASTSAFRSDPGRHLPAYLTSTTWAE